MASQVYPAWGKLNRDGPEVRIHPLIDHMFDVAACFAALAECAAIRRALTAAAGRDLDEADISRLSVLSFLHDIGKANCGFQSRRWPVPHSAPPTWPISPYGHGPEGWALVTGRVGPVAEHVLAGLPLRELDSWGTEAVYGLLQASISHHGRPVGNEPGKQVAYIWQPVRSAHGEVLYDPAVTIAAMGTQLLTSFPTAFGPCQRSLPYSALFTHLFAGLVQLADWLGSDTRPGFFDYTVPGEDRASTSRQRAAHAVRAIGLHVDSWRQALARSVPTFSAAFNVPEARPMQIALTRPQASLIILEAETGSGKTEAALWRFVHLFQSGAVDSLFFAVPTRVAASQLYERVLRFIRRVWPSEAPVVVRALPGYAAADGHTMNSLPDFKVLWSDQPGDELAHARWIAESPKRFLAATVAIGTIDQALMATLQVRHAHLRHACLSRSLLVVDEVHASDAYMTVLLEQLLKAHLATGGQALLLSATLGAVARTRYLNIGCISASHSVPSFSNASALAYPAIGYRSAGAAHIESTQGHPHHKTVHWKTLDAIDDPKQIAAIATQAAAAGARVLVIRNTVPAAVATLLAVEAVHAKQGGDWLFTVDGVSTLHHSRFSREDRPALDKAVEAQFGKHRADAKGGIIIGTQTLEQSLDIDADLLITDLCPMDVLLQRVGRLHRHSRPPAERPDAYQVPRAWVLTPSEHDLRPMLKRARHGLGLMRDGGGVYPDLRIVEATRQLVDARATRSIPGENRVLVEGATHPEALRALEAALGEEWKQVGAAIEGDTGARRGLAHLHSIPYDRPFGSTGFPDSDHKIATRLGAADRLVAFAPPVAGPFGGKVADMALRFHQLPAGLTPDVQPINVVAMPSGSGFEFALGPARYRYSRLGVQRLKADDPSLAMPGDPA